MQMTGTRGVWRMCVVYAVPSFAELVARVVDELRATGSYRATIHTRATSEIAALRKAGRRAGHELGWKVRTLVLDDEASDISTVYVVVDEDPPELATVRARQLREAVRAVAAPSPDARD